MQTATLYNKHRKALRAEVDSTGQIISILDVFDLDALPIGLQYKLRNYPHFSKWP